MQQDPFAQGVNYFGLQAYPSRLPDRTVYRERALATNNANMTARYFPLPWPAPGAQLFYRFGYGPRAANPHQGFSFPPNLCGRVEARVR